MNYVTASLKDLLPSNQKAVIKFKITPGKKIDSICQCNQKTCMICSRKRSSSMLSLKSIKNSVAIDENSPGLKRTDNKNNFVIQSSLLSKQLSRQVSNHQIQNQFYNGKINQESKGSTNSTTWIMTNSHSRKISVDSPIKEIQQQTLNSMGIGRHSFKFLYVVGKGGFGKVWRVEMKANRQEFALKEMLKTKIISKRSVNSVMNEKFLLEHLKHPFLVNMHYAFQDRENLYLVLDILRGGDLRYHIGRMKKFSEEQTKFFACCILLSLQYLHQHGIIHRDVKPENLVFDKDGFLRLTDLGVARLNKDSVANDTSGTPGYMAPEVMCRMEHSFPVDYYAVGVIVYELLIGKRPYNGKNRQEIREQILAKQIQIKENTPGISNKAIDFVNKLLIRKPQQRLGFNGIDEILNHSWLHNFPWGKLLNKEIRSLYVPGSIDGNYDFQSQISADSDPSEDSSMVLRRKSVQGLFEGYKFQ
ncbi:unnamed protein product (macronuclear) [Paramecium tetraurelia]|uniref:non-specific serine/threonine protein kinase n=1 Tax=Paramecium tetraurelia TaxID=5888 RepID=A0C519_PARTE|nr:uncharacterized protein GSPATT00006385001 [Paramecium tetraurelia]CAK65886.1 unnamed protein product [Paramecium tetraurelia]|eukprot:XP_001433283.1 hypothetical protein (macronuclear) [Paramecium tetraurelia strain d4-2]